MATRLEVLTALEEDYYTLESENIDEMNVEDLILKRFVSAQIIEAMEKVLETQRRQYMDLHARILKEDRNDDDR